MRLVLAVACCVLGLGCSDAAQDPTDAGDDRTSIVTPDGAVGKPDGGRQLTAHDGTTLPAMKLGIVYVGDVDAGAAPSQDTDVTWLLGSPYWLLLDEYGIGNGTVLGSARVATDAFFQSGDVDGNGLVDMIALQARLVAALHGDGEGGVGTVSIPGAEAYLLYLPDGINVALGHHGSYTFQTCIDSSGYHAYDGTEPYAVLPPCTLGRTLYAASHELTEMATDPKPYDGWASDDDISVNGGEVADLCAEQVFAYGVFLTRLWSNQGDGCMP